MTIWTRANKIFSAALVILYKAYRHAGADPGAIVLLDSACGGDELIGPLACLRARQNGEYAR